MAGGGHIGRVHGGQHRIGESQRKRTFLWS